MPTYLKIIDRKGATSIAGPYESEFAPNCRKKIEALEGEGLFCETFRHRSIDLSRVTRSYKEGQIGETGVSFEEATSRVKHTDPLAPKRRKLQKKSTMKDRFFQEELLDEL